MEPKPFNILVLEYDAPDKGPTFQMMMWTLPPSGTIIKDQSGPEHLDYEVIFLAVIAESLYMHEVNDADDLRLTTKAAVYVRLVEPSTTRLEF